MAEKAAVCTLWGSSRTLRNLQLLPPIDCVAGEEAKLEEMRALMGRYASTARLTTHLRAVRGKVFWAVNRYLREELMLGTITDFDPKPLPRKQTLPPQLPIITSCQTRVTASTQQDSDGDASRVESSVDWEQLPDSLIFLTLAKLSHQDLLQLSATCKWLKPLTSSDTLWRSLYLNRWGKESLSALTSSETRCVIETTSAVSECLDQSVSLLEVQNGASQPSREEFRMGLGAEEACQSSSSGCQDGANDTLPGVDGATSEVRSLDLDSEESEWKERFHHKLDCERVSQCPRCENSKFVPIVYGFPSQALVVGMKSERLLLGGDHLTDYPGFSPLWACHGCNARWITHPYSKQSKGPLDQAQYNE